MVRSSAPESDNGSADKRLIADRRPVILSAMTVCVCSGGARQWPDNGPARRIPAISEFSSFLNFLVDFRVF